MSLLNSILSSINDGQAKPSTTTATTKPNAPSRRDNSAPAATQTQGSTHSTTSRPVTSAPVKRKAEDVGRNMMTKAPRVDASATTPTSISRSTTNSPAPSRQNAAPPLTSQVPYRGTASAKPSTASTTTSKAGASTTSAPTTPATAAPPKTGYLAILERAKAAQEAAKQAGQIKHKPAEKLTKRDRLRLQAEAAAAQRSKGGASSKSAAAGPRSRSKSADAAVGNKAGAASSVKKERKPTDLGYKGTMRATPAAPHSYTGTMRPSGSSNTAPRRKQQGAASSGDRYRYASYSDEDDDDDMEEEEDYESESDMEAGIDDVDREEEEALRAAKREDAAAAREESELKRAKEEKKRRLEALAAGAKKKRY